MVRDIDQWFRGFWLQLIHGVSGLRMPFGPNREYFTISTNPFYRLVFFAVAKLLIFISRNLL